jgi:hypothetical protein
MIGDHTGQYWRLLFQRLSAVRASINAIWTVKNGTSFWMTIPKGDDVRENSFAEYIGFPFTLDDISSVKILDKFGVGSNALINDIEKIHSAIGQIQGLTITKFVDEIEISC